MWGSRQCSSGREDWPGRQSQGRCSPREGSGSKLRDYKGGKISWWGKLKFLITLKPPVLSGPLFRVEVVVAVTMLVEFLLRHATLD